MAAEYNIDVVIGDSWPPGPGAEFVITVREGPDGGPYTAISLASATVTAELTHKEQDAPGTLTLDVKNQTTNTGQVGIRLDADQSALLSNYAYHWRIKIAFDATNVLTPIAGLLTASKL